MKLDGIKVKDALSSTSGKGINSQIPRTHVPTKLCSKGSTLVTTGSTWRVPYFLQVALHSFTNIKTKVCVFLFIFSKVHFSKELECFFAHFLWIYDVIKKPWIGLIIVQELGCFVCCLLYCNGNFVYFRWTHLPGKEWLKFQQCFSIPAF